jgi:hypothetical protein
MAIEASSQITGPRGCVCTRARHGSRSNTLVNPTTRRQSLDRPGTVSPTVPVLRASPSPEHKHRLGTTGVIT